jgi:TIR domain
MPNEAAAGFWSYAHEDNELDRGAILELAQLIKEEYNLLSGEPLELFVDRDSIAWGQEWRERIDSSLAETTFFIPIITPRYFTRPECRRELLEFSAKAKSLGVQDLLLPILYIETQGLSVESSDEAVALVARTQYVDWHTIRLLEPSSRDYKTAVNALARRLLEIAKSVAEIQFNHEINADPEDDGTDGITDIVEKVMALIPEWLDAVLGEKVNDVQMHATWHQFMVQFDKLQRAHALASAVLSAQTRAAKEMLPLAERAQRDARIYLARSIELDPLISALARLVTEHPESYDLVVPIREAIDEAIVEIRKSDEAREKPGYHTIGSHFDEMRHLGRIFQRCSAIFREENKVAREGNDIVRRWDAELGRPPSATSSG